MLLVIDGWNVSLNYFTKILLTINLMFSTEDNKHNKDSKSTTRVSTFWSNNSLQHYFLMVITRFMDSSASAKGAEEVEKKRPSK